MFHFYTASHDSERNPSTMLPVNSKVARLFILLLILVQYSMKSY